MKIFHKLYFLLSKKKYILDIDREGSAEITYRNGETYLIPGSIIVAQRCIEVYLDYIKKIQPEGDTVQYISKEKIIEDIINYMKKFDYQVVIKSESVQ